MSIVRRVFGDTASGLAIAAGLTLAGCSGGAGSGATTPTPATPTPVTPTPTPTVGAAPTGLFVNPAPDAGGDATKASAAIGWTATTGATSYIVRYTVNGGAATSVTTSATPGTILTGLPAGAALSVTIAAFAGAETAASGPVTATLPSPPTAAELAAYASAAAYSDAAQGEAVVVLKNGATVYTHYSAGYANAAHPLASGTKSFSCAFEIFAEADGLVTLADKAASTITDWTMDVNKAKITVLDLLSLQSGLTGNPGYSATAATTLDTYALTVADTATYAPGQAFVYDPLSFQAFALIFQIKTGGIYTGAGQVAGGTDPLTYLQTKLFTPLGITLNASSWTRDAKGRPQMAGGAYLPATEWLRYGQLVLQKGTFGTARLLDANKLQQCVGGYDNPAYLGYGITWWLNKHSAGTYDPTIDQVPRDGGPAPGSDQFAPHAPLDTVMAAGTGKERLYIIPSLGIAIVRYAPLNSGGPTSTWSDDTFLGKAIGTVP